MAKYFLAALIAAATLFSSCSRIQAYYHTAGGNYQYERGNYQEANVDYFSARETGAYGSEIAYNLGNLYHSLGEDDAAMEEWEKVASDSPTGLRERQLFNRGVVMYERGEYQSAYELFRGVLEINPLNKGAKINLEHALRKLSSRSGVEAASSVGESSVGGDAERILQYIKNKREAQWRSPTEDTSESSGRDW